MANTHTLLQTVTTTSNQASVTLGSGGTISQLYTDLKIIASLRSVGGTAAADQLRMTFNGSGSNYKDTAIYGDGGAVSTFKQTSNSWGFPGGVQSAPTTANIFTAGEIYIPNYVTSKYKSWSGNFATENNATQAFFYLAGGLWVDNSAITSITFTVDPGNSATGFATNSTFYLYGISNA